MTLRLGTRGSELARTQSGLVADALRDHGHAVELVTIRSEGDVTAASLVAAGGLGVFAAALRRALLDGEVDLAVHSLKDLPTAGVPGLVLAAIAEREDAADVLCARHGHTLASLPAGARVGTGSPRRAAQVRARRPDVEVVEIRGNVGTRLARAFGSASTKPDLDAVVLAHAGLARLGRLDAVTDVLDLLPAAGQGALAVECREDDAVTRLALAPLDHPATRAEVEAERAVLAALGAGCAAPVGVRATLAEGRLRVRAAVLAADGRASATAKVEAPWPTDAAALGRRAARQLLDGGAADITPLGAERASRLGEFHDQELWAPGTHPALVGRRVLFLRADGPLTDAVRAAGALVDARPLTSQRSLAYELGGRADWLVLTSPAGVQRLVADGHAPAALAPRIAAVGRATASALQAAGAHVDVTGSSDAAGLVAELGDGPGTILLPGSALAEPTLAEGLAARGWTVRRVATYTTETLPSALAGLVADWPAYDAVVVTAGSVARAAVQLLGPPAGHTRIVAFGRPSADAARAAGLPVHAVAATPDGDGVLAALIAALEELP